MKDSQLSIATPILLIKYIKVNNERFSTPDELFFEVK